MSGRHCYWGKSDRFTECFPMHSVNYHYRTAEYRICFQKFSEKTSQKQTVMPSSPSGNQEFAQVT